MSPLVEASCEKSNFMEDYEAILDAKHLLK